MKLVFDSGDRPLDIPIRAWRDILKAGTMAVAMYFEEHVKPRKFEASAASLDNFQKRTAKYLKKKVGGIIRTPQGGKFPVKEGGERDWVYSGRTRTAVLKPSKVRAFPTRARVDLNTPDYVRERTRNGAPPGTELTSVTGEEFQEMERVYAAAVEAALNQYRQSRGGSV